MNFFYTDIKRFGNSILYRGFDEHGNRIHKKIKFKPHLYVPVAQRWGTKDSVHMSGWHSFDGVPVEPVEMETMRDAKEFIDKYSSVSGFSIHGNTNYVSQYIQRTWPNDIEYNANRIRVANIDIEVKSDEGFPQPEYASHPIVSIAYKSSVENVYYVWGMDDYDVNNCSLDLNGALIQYTKCKDEVSLLLSFLARWKRHDNDVVTGWNIKGFDIPYIVNRMIKICDKNVWKELSPWKIVNDRTHKFNGKEYTTYEIYGIQQLDYMDLFRKFGYYVYGNQESYSLDHIANVVCGERKLSYEEHGNLHTLYKNDYQKFISYNVRDVQLVEKIDKESGLMNQAFALAYKGGVNYTDTLGTTGIWDSIMNRHLAKQKIVIPDKKQTPKIDYPGGYVKEPIVGKHDWVVSFDLNSLYPNILVQWNMSPETIVKTELEYPNGVSHYMDNSPFNEHYSTAANGTKYRKDIVGVIPSIITYFYDERRVIKNRMLEVEQELTKNTRHDLQVERNQLDTQQMAIKILMNSLYGALGNQYFRYYDPQIAEAVTITGQLCIKWAERAINEYLNKLYATNDDYVIAIDTDSLYVNFKPLIDKVKPSNPVDFLDKVSKTKIEPILSDAYQHLHDKMSSRTNRMEMSREVIADKGIWTGKKHYILNVWDKEGVRYETPKMKVMGLEAVKSSTPMICRTKMKEAFSLLLTGSEKDIQKFVKDFETEFKTLGFEDISFPRGVSDIEKWKSSPALYKKGTPIHVRGSIIYNELLRTHNMKNEETIKNGSKIKYCYLVMPNPTRENVISFSTFMPKEFELDAFIDYNTQFEKTFKEPLKQLTNAIGWQLEHVNSLDAFF